MSDRKSILIVDDEDAIRQSLAGFLRQSGYPDVIEAKNGQEALNALEQRRFFLVITDISMPIIGGLELLARIRRDYRQTDVAVITGHLELDFAIQAIKNGAFDYFKKPFRFEEVISTIKRVEEKQYLERRSLELELLRERRMQEEMHLKEFLLALAQIIDMKSRYTLEHSDRTSKISRLMAERCGLSRDEVERISLGARLHDVGKMAVPDCILDKPGALTPEEFATMKAHSARGAELCQPISCLAPVVPMIRWHHENLDGTGYPDGLKGDQIPLDARIVRIADYWDAITSKRSYRSPMSDDDAIRIIQQECNAKRLDTELCRSLFESVRAGLVDRLLVPAHS
ncbi:MAG: HD domain-containing phosphohydrolase [Planctomycetota bacterium]